MLQGLIFSFLIILLSSCGGGGGGGSPSTPNNPPPNNPPSVPDTITDKTAAFLDSVVQGVGYSVDGGSEQFTNDKGEFNYRSNDSSITFTIGALTLKQDFDLSAITDGRVFPTDLVGVSRTDTSNAEVVEILQILQSLDNDQNPDNGIRITSAARASITTRADTVAAARADIPENIAIDHFRKTLKTELDLDVGLVFTNDRIKSVAENQTTAITLEAVDNDNNAITYTIAEGDSSAFNLNGGTVTFKTAPNFEQQQTYTFTATADNGATNIRQTIVIRITDVNELSGTPPTSVAEDSNYIFTPVGFDADGTTLVYSIVNQPAWADFDATNGRLSGTPDNDDVGTSGNIIISVSDTEASASLAPFTITVTNTNDAPVIANGATAGYSVLENQTAVADIAVTDVDGDTPALTLTGADFSLFQITAGVLSFINAPNFEDTTHANIYEITVTADDGNGGTDEQTITITVTDVDEPAALNINNLADSSIAENTAYTSTTPRVDDIIGGGLTYSLGGADVDLFTVAANGVVSLSARDFETPADAGANNIYNYTLTVTDSDNNTANQAVVLTITNVKENTITIADQIFSINENAPIGSIVGTVTASGTPTGYSIASSDFAIDNDGQITNIKALNFENKQTYTAVVTVSEADADDKKASITINITDVIEPATLVINNLTDSSIAENMAYTSATPSVDDIIGGGLTYSLSGADTDLFTVAVNGVVTLSTRDFENPADADTNNIYEYTLMVTDSDGNTATQPVFVTITDVKENTITIAANQIFSINENAPRGSIVGTVTTTGTPTSYFISGLNFVINNNGQITSAITLDFRTEPVYMPIVTITKTNAADVKATITINIADVAENVAAPTADNANIVINLLPQPKTAKMGQISATDINNNPLTYSISQPPILGSVAIDANNGSYTYTTNVGQTDADNDLFEVSVSNGQAAAATAVIRVNLKTDPLYKHQWHLNNTGQTGFALNGGIVGEDINANVAINRGLTGAGVIVAVVDEGLEIAHEDLRANVVAGGSHDFIGNDDNPTNPNIKGDHGTSVAGLIAARGWNDLGGRGVAPFASIKGFNALLSLSQFNEISALGGATYAADVDIFNQSYSRNRNVDTRVNPNLEAQFKSGVNNLRNGKGAIYITSAGNGFNGYIVNRLPNNCGASTFYRLTCQNANMDPTNTLPYRMVVGALNADGEKAGYSTAGSAIWVSAPGGENIRIIGTSIRLSPAMITTDQSGCLRGYARSNGVFSGIFDDGDGPHIDNPDCNYTSLFSGTSSAAPVTAGVAALILEANPELTWRDVKHILATTADQVHDNIPTTVLRSTQSTILGTFTITYDAEPAWLTNAAGLKFHNYYGFGRINAGNAVIAAQNYTMGSLGTFTTTVWNQSGALNLGIIPDISTTGISHSITDNSDLTVEAVQIRVNVDHTFSGELAIELTSPAGTKSVLMNAYNGFNGDNNLLNMVLLSNAFYGENSSGNWTIKIIDTGLGDLGILENWSIRIFGH